MDDSFFNDESKSFLSVVPNISQTPPTQTKTFDCVKNVMKRITSNESHIKDREKFEDLYKLGDRVFTARNNQFPWDLNQCVEAKGTDNGAVLEINDMDVDSKTSDGPINDIVYETNSFVAVKPYEYHSETATQKHFWSGTLNEIIYDDLGRAAKLSV